MRCKTCDYPLWNLHARQCPECGGAFKPSEFRFALNAVRYCCPHCGQEYYGTDADGHLEPRGFDCLGCGRRIDMDEMVLQPTEGVEDRFTRAECSPWLDEDRRFWSRWFSTLFRGACTPVWLMRVTPINSDAGRAWAFAFLTHIMLGAAAVLPFLALSVTLAAFTTGGGGGLAGVAGFGVGSVVGAGLGSLAMLGLWVLTAHGVLRLCGPTAGGIGRTAQALCYTCGGQVIWLVPCLNFYFGWIGSLWWVIVGGIALAAGQKVSGPRAAMAVLVLPLLCAVLLAAVIVAAVADATSSVAAARALQAGGVSAFQPAFRDSSAWPAHAGELLLDGSVAVYDLTSPQSSTMSEDCSLGGVTLDLWPTLTPQEQLDAVAAAIDTLPPDTVAYRLGDFVFTHPGIDLSTADPALWLVVEAWDPAAEGQRTQPVITVLEMGGWTEAISPPSFREELAAQNALRAARGLPPLPDPLTLRVDRPATAERPDAADPPADPG